MYLEIVQFLANFIKCSCYLVSTQFITDSQVWYHARGDQEISNIKIKKTRINHKQFQKVRNPQNHINKDTSSFVLAVVKRVLATKSHKINFPKNIFRLKSKTKDLKKTPL